jgi:two-component system OmpR family sensor kinase
MTAPHASEPGRPASGLRRWLAGRTLRGRLITGLVALLAVACAVVGIVTYLALRQTLLNQIDRQLTAAGGRYASCMEANDAIERAREAQQDGESGGGGPVPGQTTPGPAPGEQDCSAIPGLAAGTFGTRVKNGVVTAQGVVGGKSHPTAADKAALARLTPAHHFSSMELPWLGADYRLIAVHGHDGDVLITGLPLTDMESTLRKIELASIAVSAAVLLLTGIIGTAFVGLSLRPLRRVAATATRVTQLPLASGEVSLPERVPDADPRTEVGQVGAAFNRMLGHVESALTRRAASEARLRRRRQPRAAHTSGGDPGLCRTRPPASRPGPGRHRPRARPGGVGVRTDERAGGRTAAAGPAGRGPPAGQRAGRPDPAGHRRCQRR